MKLTNRLMAVASKVPVGSVIADVGTDHAKIPIYLFENKIIKSAIATDINAGPIEIAKRNIAQNGYSDFIQTRLGPGLTTICPGEVNTVIIAGMGGILIKDILEESTQLLDSIETFVFQPMLADEVLREWLCKHNFYISDEMLAKEENKYYITIVAKHGCKEADQSYFKTGKKLIENKDPLIREYLNKKISEQEKILNDLKVYNSENAVKRKNEVEKELEMLYTMLTLAANKN